MHSRHSGFERVLVPEMPAGSDIAIVYTEDILKMCDKFAGLVMVFTVADQVVGCITGSY